MYISKYGLYCFIPLLGCVVPYTWHMQPLNEDSWTEELSGGAIHLTLIPLSARLRYLARVGDLEATDTEDPDLNYGLVVDCGSSGSRIFVYFWPRHNGNPHDLLDIKQMRDRNSQPVVKKIKPGTEWNLYHG